MKRGLFEERETMNRILLKTKAGITVSIIQGPGAYAGEFTVEVGAWDKNGDWIQLTENDPVDGYVDVPRLIRVLQELDK